MTPHPVSDVESGSATLRPAAGDLELVDAFIAASRALIAVAARSLAGRTRTREDRRTVRVYLTRSGRDTVGAVTDRRRAEVAAILAAMPTDNRAALTSALRAFAGAAGEVPEQDWALGWDEAAPRACSGAHRGQHRRGWQQLQSISPVTHRRLLSLLARVATTHEHLDLMLSAEESKDFTEQLAIALSARLEEWQPRLIDELSRALTNLSCGYDAGADEDARFDDFAPEARAAADAFLSAVRSFIADWLSARDVEEPQFTAIALAAEKRAAELASLSPPPTAPEAPPPSA
jgi:hypothetical protein